jgi:anoctamin-10/anoctamin-7
MLLKEECLLGYFPLHDYVELRTLEEKWLRFCQLPWHQPVDEVKDYYGEKIGLYFLWLGHYTAWLIPASVVGFGCWINVAAKDNDPNAVIMPYFAAFVALWSTLFLESWKRKEKTYAMRWGMVGYEEEETSRPQFIGVRKPSPVTGRPYLFFSREEKHMRLFKSSSIIFGFIIVVIGVVASIFVLRLVLSRVDDLVVGDIQLAGIICSLLNAVQIQVLNMIYGWAAIALNNYENHRTDTQYEDNLIAKTFVFQFVNSFAALIYVAFFKPFLQESDPCLGRYIHYCNRIL